MKRKGLLAGSMAIVALLVCGSVATAAEAISAVPAVRYEFDGNVNNVGDLHSSRNTSLKQAQLTEPTGVPLSSTTQAALALLVGLGVVRAHRRPRPLPARRFRGYGISYG